MDERIGYEDRDERFEPEAEPATPTGDRVQGLVQRLRTRYADRITGVVEHPARTGQYADIPTDLPEALATALRARGIERLYSHQAEALAAARAGRDLVVVTPTASGKTLCYNLPVIEAILATKEDAVFRRSARERANDLAPPDRFSRAHARSYECGASPTPAAPGAKALYLFPTKALAQDQLAELLELNRLGDLGVRAHTFDGDTPGDARKAIRLKGDIVVSNPDMLHQAILPHHTKWAQFFEQLRYVVIDEIHHYRGVFGSHLASVIRRLERIAAFYGARPVYLLCSATIGNPREHAEALLGRTVQAITESGAPTGARTLLLWNPPVVNPDLGIRASARSQSTRLARLSVRAGLKTLVFAQSRVMVEVIAKYLKDVFDRNPLKPPRVRAYRGGYLPNARRATEQALRAGDISVAVTTSALELGVDIGALDVVLLNGYPGSIAATWQRLGRAGRRQQSALGVLVAGSDALDQYLVQNPDEFSRRSPEHARIAREQPLIVLDHVRCAAFELPFRSGESFGEVDPIPFLTVLGESGVLHRDGDTWYWIAESYPANAVSLRSVAEGNFLVVDRTGDREAIVAEVDYASAALTLYPGAIYLLQSEPFQVERLDWIGRKAYVRAVPAEYYTDAIDYTKLKVLERFAAEVSGAGECQHGEVHVVRRVAGYKKIRFYTHENIGYGPVNLPDHEMHTTALSWQLPGPVLEAAFPARSDALDGFLGAAYALHTVACLVAMAEPRDLGKAVGSGDADWFAVMDAQGRGQLRAADGTPLPEHALRQFAPTVFLYDNYPGGIGMSEPLYRMRGELIARAQRLIDDCACVRGCPACVGPVPPKATLRDDEAASPKARARRVLALLGAA